MPSSVWRWVRALLGVALVTLVTLSLIKKWDDVRNAPIAWDINWVLVAASLVVTWVMYVVLIAGWRTVLTGWGQKLDFYDSASIWTISSLGKYLPGKVWAIAGMAMMAEKRGVAPAAATGSAIVMQLLAIASGTSLALAFLGTTALDQLPGGSIVGLGLSGVALLVIVGLTMPSVTGWVGRLLKRPEGLPPVDPESLTGAMFTNLVAWCGYGFALWLLLRGTIPTANLGIGQAIGAFAASYLAGFLMLLAPGGLLVREGALFVLVRGAIGDGPALALAAASRFTLTINEVGAAVPFLLARRSRSD